MADLDVLLDLLCSQHLQNAAQSLLELAATKGLVDVSMVSHKLSLVKLLGLRSDKSFLATGLLQQPLLLAGHESCGCVDRDPAESCPLPGCVGLMHIEHCVLHHRCKLFMCTMAALCTSSSFLLACLVPAPNLPCQPEVHHAAVRLHSL